MNTSDSVTQTINMRPRWRDFFELCKPRVVALMMLTTLVGMQCASDDFIPWQPLVFGTLGIAFASAAGAVINHLVDHKIDAKMQRTHGRPIPCGRVSVRQALLFGLVLTFISMLTLGLLVNPLTAMLTFCTFLGYAVFYTLYLKRTTPQNIVIGGLFGAMPPLLGWTAVSNTIDPNGLLLALIIFIWTPPHFWALAIYRYEDYQKADIPMLPVTHGIPFTRLCILLYTILLVGVSVLPYVTHMSGLIYLISSLVLGLIFLGWAIALFVNHSPRIALNTFRFSILYLMLLFIALLLDHQWFVY